ncbi:MAG: hypothetical protein QOJ99_171 [Bryobacterales bacterium]|jgi:hypothetical protein|nr:hypothetical protein [Bryobacterales bacterium]
MSATARAMLSCAQALLPLPTAYADAVKQE